MFEIFDISGRVNGFASCKTLESAMNLIEDNTGRFKNGDTLLIANFETGEIAWVDIRLTMSANLRDK